MPDRPTPWYDDSWLPFKQRLFDVMAEQGCEIEGLYFDVGELDICRLANESETGAAQALLNGSWREAIIDAFDMIPASDLHQRVRAVRGDLHGFPAGGLLRVTGVNKPVYKIELSGRTCHLVAVSFPYRGHPGPWAYSWNFYHSLELAKFPPHSLVRIKKPAVDQMFRTESGSIEQRLFENVTYRVMQTKFETTKDLIDAYVRHCKDPAILQILLQVWDDATIVIEDDHHRGRVILVEEECDLRLILRRTYPSFEVYEDWLELVDEDD